MKPTKTERELAKARANAGRAYRQQLKQPRPSEYFDWDRAITGLHRIFAELGKKYPRP